MFVNLKGICISNHFILKYTKRSSNNKQFSTKRYFNSIFYKTYLHFLQSSADINIQPKSKAKANKERERGIFPLIFAFSTFVHAKRKMICDKKKKTKNKAKNKNINNLKSFLLKHDELFNISLD